MPDTNARVEDYLTYWLARVVQPTHRPKTYQSYESVVRVHLIPGLARKKLRTMRAAEVRARVDRVASECQCCKHGWDKKRGEAHCCSVGECCSRPSLAGWCSRSTLSSGTYDVGKGQSVAQARLLLKYAVEDRLYALYMLAVAMHAAR